MLDTTSVPTQAPLPTPAPPPVPPGFIRRVLLVVGITAAAVFLFLLFWKLAIGVLLVFAGALVAVALHGLSETMRERTHLPASLCLLLILLVLALALGSAGWFLASELGRQFEQLLRGLAKGTEEVRLFLLRQDWGQNLFEHPLQPSDIMTGLGNLFWGVTGVFTTLVGGVLGVVACVFLGVYLAADPGLYNRGLLRLLPVRHRHRGQEVINATASTLRWWLVGQFINMTIIGIATGIGLWCLDIPGAMALALLTFLLTFVPFFGAVVAAIPAILVALTISPLQAMNVVVLYLGVHMTEGYLLSPLVQRVSVELPPALTIASQVLLGLLFGALGVFLATPLAAAGLVLVRMLYLEDVLGETEPAVVAAADDGTIPARLQPQNAVPRKELVS